MTLPPACLAMTRRKRIAHLNDRCRLGLDRTAQTVITRSCLAAFGHGTAAAEAVHQLAILAAIRAIQFADDDKTERGRGQIEYEGETVYFVIDAYDVDLRYGSDDPADPSITRRVMTIMMHEDL